MEIKIVRDRYEKKYTLGKLYVEDTLICDTLEDTYRELNSEKDKIYGETCIPKGRYKVIMTFSPHFKRVLPELMYVPYFKNIRIHSGNTTKDTLGCILVGTSNNDGTLINSKQSLSKLLSILNDCKEDIYITIV